MKKSFSKISKTFSRQTLFSALAVVMICILGGVIIYATTFLVSVFDSTFEPEVKPAPAERFDMQGFETLQLMKQKQ